MCLLNAASGPLSHYRRSQSCQLRGGVSQRSRTPSLELNHSHPYSTRPLCYLGDAPKAPSNDAFAGLPDRGVLDCLPRGEATPLMGGDVTELFGLGDSAKLPTGGSCCFGLVGDSSPLASIMSASASTLARQPAVSLVIWPQTTSRCSISISLQLLYELLADSTESLLRFA